MRIFLSHNKADKDIARALGSALVLAGADVWFDEWEIKAGDSIPGKLNEGLKDFDTFILLWSKNASKSSWVRRELESAIHHVIEGGKGRAVPCLLDDTPLPALLRDIKGVDLIEKNAIPELVDSLLGFRTRKEFLMAIQDTLHSMELSWHINEGAGPYICCPKCGEEQSIKGWQQLDEKRDDLYVGLKCVNCGWSEGSEI